MEALIILFLLKLILIFNSQKRHIEDALENQYEVVEDDWK